MASSIETNKVVAAVLAAGIIASGSGVVSRMLYHREMPEENAYPIAVVEEAGGGGGGEAAESAEVSLAALLASADPAAGEGVSKKCSSCHSFEEGGPNKIGPHLWGVLGRQIASVSDFSYSDALHSKEGAWDYESLNAFLANPKDWAPGTKMSFAGLRKPEDRAEMILYLRSLGASDTPLPEPAAATTEAAPAAEAASAETAAAEPATEVASTETAAAEPAAEAASTETAAAEPATEVATTETAAAEPATEGASTETAAAETTTEGAGPETAAVEPASEGPTESATATDASGGETGQAVAALETAPAQGAAAAGDAGATGGSELAARLAAADAETGAKDARKCATCHSFEQGGKKKIGPPLWGVIGRDIASVEDFSYSNALESKDGAWDYAKLDAYLADPKGWAPGNKMAFAGLRKPEDRADVILYLRSLAEDPAPLP